MSRLPAETLVTAVLRTGRRVAFSRAESVMRHLSWKRIFKPCVLGFAALAFAITLWGFGYKLSRYYHHPAPLQQAMVVKLWIEPPGATLVAIERLRNLAHLTAGPQALSASIQWLPRLDRAACVASPTPRCGVLFFDFPAPLRSPPPRHFRSA
jgi:hypothetical protein